ncbi:protein GOLVEN 6 [Actinidia eriantha]|uniref:protein GOLVEN 6 n=1 Tax=Actinidia eriantha TaxID=165200 RepID=UPI00258B7CD5|nr:protein GOLVEN 6 [Actinidia eriantha]
MELIIVITTLCISFSIMLTPSAPQQIQVQSIHHQGQDPGAVSVLTLPRKLGLIGEAAATVPINEVKVNGGKDLHPYKLVKGSFSSKQSVKRTGTRQEWMEGTDTSEFFTMDYTKVRRRRPIHNKSLPAAP